MAFVHLQGLAAHCQAWEFLGTKEPAGTSASGGCSFRERSTERSDRAHWDQGEGGGTPW